MSLIARQLLVCLAAAHVLADFWFQSDRMVREKRNPRVLFRHALIVALLSYLLCGAWSVWIIPTGAFVAHAVVDAVKARVSRRNANSFILDQLGHAMTLVGIATVAAWEEPTVYGLTVLGVVYLKGLIAITGLVLSVFAGGVLIDLAVEPLNTRMLSTSGTSERAGPDESRGFEDGGKYIGWLERALIFLFVVSGQPASIGFLIAAKSIFRFGELKEHRHRMEAEYIVIGTMMSFGFGLTLAYATTYVLNLAWM